MWAVRRHTMDRPQSKDHPAPIQTLEGDWSPEPVRIPRWGQIIAGVVLLPVALISTAGAVSIFGIPKVQSDPLLQLLAAAICLLAIWAVVLACRLVLGRRGKWFFGPLALRISAVAAIGLVVGGAFTGIWIDHPIRSAALSIAYVLLAVRLWNLAAYRSSSVA